MENASTPKWMFLSLCLRLTPSPLIHLLMAMDNSATLGKRTLYTHTLFLFQLMIQNKIGMPATKKANTK